MKILNSLLLGIISMLFLLSCNTTQQSNKEDSKVEQVPITKKKPVNMDSFFQAALDGKIAVLEDAIKNDVDVNSVNAENRTALMLSAFNGHVNIVKLLIDNGADVHVLDSAKRTALIFASTGPFNSTVEVLLKAGSDPNVADNVEKWTAVMFAAAEGQLEVVKTLVANGADLSMVDKDGESSYDFAVANKHTELAEYLKNQKK